MNIEVDVVGREGVLREKRGRR